MNRLDVILRSEIVERAKAGDKCTFTGTFIVVPDVSQLGVPGVNAEIMRESKGGRGDGGVASQGVTGLKSLGVRDLQYKTAFLACMVQGADARVSWRPTSSKWNYEKETNNRLEQRMFGAILMMERRTRRHF